jgi:hypothetical protein
MNWAAYQGILGVGTSTLNPRGNAHRSHTVATLHRVVNMFSIEGTNLPPLTEIPGAPPQTPPPPPPPQHQLLQYNTLTEGAITATTPVVTYRLEVPSAGRVTINLTRPATGGFPNNGADVRWLNENRTQLMTNGVGTGTFTRFMDLEAGTYFIEVVRRSTNTGSFFITAGFDSAENDARAINNTIANAEPLSFAEQRVGFISYQNGVDIYKIELAQPGRVRVNLTRPAVGGLQTSGAGFGANVRWLDVNGIQIATNGIGSGNFTRFMDLEAGTYFVEVSRNTISSTGRYFLVADFTASGRTAGSPINTITTAQALDFGQSVTGFITHQFGVNIYKITVPAGSSRSVTVSLTRPAAAAGGFPSESFAGNLRWLDVNGIQLFTNTVGSGNFTNTRTLSPGTYYIEFARIGTNSGIYNLVINMT